MIRIIFLFLTFCAVLHPAVAGQGSLKKATFIPLWKPQAQFAGYYVALEKGFYRKAGLDVTIIEGGPDSPPGALLEQGKADFGILWLSAALKKRGHGLKIVNIGQVVQRSGLMLVAKRSSGIRVPKDLAGRKVSLWDGELRLQPMAFFRKYALSVDIIPQSYTVNLFLAGGVDAASVMWYNEYDTILNAGIDEGELVAFSFGDHGLNFPEDGIYCREETLAKDPGAAFAFAAASFEGWLYAFNHPEEALNIVLAAMRKAHVPANRVHQKWMLEKMKELILPSGDRRDLGLLDKEDYANVCRELRSGKDITEAPAYDDFFLPEKP